MEEHGGNESETKARIAAYYGGRRRARIGHNQGANPPIEISSISCRDLALSAL